MQIWHGLRIESCRACHTRAARLSGLCTLCLRIFTSQDMSRLDRFFDMFFGGHMGENDAKSSR